MLDVSTGCPIEYLQHMWRWVQEQATPSDPPDFYICKVSVHSQIGWIDRPLPWKLSRSAADTNLAKAS